MQIKSMPSVYFLFLIPIPNGNLLQIRVNIKQNTLINTQRIKILSSLQTPSFLILLNYQSLYKFVWEHEVSDGR